jgi:hypothetical protein
MKMTLMFFLREEKEFWKIDYGRLLFPFIVMDSGCLFWNVVNFIRNKVDFIPTPHTAKTEAKGDLLKRNEEKFVMAVKRDVINEGEKK